MNKKVNKPKLTTTICKLILVCILTSSCIMFPKDKSDLPNWIKNQPKGINFVDFAPSPDGKIIIFTYIDRSLSKHRWQYYYGLGLFNTDTGELKRIPNPPQKQLSVPSFSYDGKRLLVGISPVGGFAPTQIGIMNLATAKVIPVISKTGVKLKYPVFQPKTGNILYFYDAHNSEYGLNLFNTKTKTEKVIINEKQGFYYIMRPFFISNDEIIFQASGANESRLREKTKKFGAIPLTYKLKLGARPQFLSLETELKARYDKNLPNTIAFSQLSASKTGKLISYIKSVPKIYPSERYKTVHELFKFENGKEIQLTNNRSIILRSVTSYDGSIVAFVSNVAKDDRFDLCIYETKKGNTIVTNVLDRIRNNPDFSLK